MAFRVAISLVDTTAWLGGGRIRTDKCRFRKCPLKCVANLPRFRKSLGTRDFSRARCSKRDVHLLAGLVGRRQDSNRVSRNKFSDI
jgi:hypothetical protein